MTRKARVRVVGRIDNVSSATITIDATAGLISVRPYRRHREYTLPLVSVAQEVVTSELAEKKRSRKRVRRGVL